MNITELHAIKSKIISELQPILPDIHVSTTPNNTLVHRTTSTTMSGEEYYTHGPRAYVGMMEGVINIYWDKFFDRICGNGWMYGKDYTFKFDVKDGDCKYCSVPTFLPDLVNQWIIKIKSELLQLDIDYNAHKQLESL